MKVENLFLFVHVFFLSSAIAVVTNIVIAVIIIVIIITAIATLTSDVDLYY